MDASLEAARKKGDYESFDYDGYQKQFDEGKAARVSVLAREPEAYHVTIEVPKDAKAGQEFTAVVHVKNITKRNLDRPYITLMETPPELEVAGGAGFIMGNAGDDLTIVEPTDETSASSDDPLKPGQEVTRSFQVTAKAEMDHAPLFASVSAGNGGLAIGAVDAKIETTQVAKK
jgi:hypothetical protein